MAMIVRCLGIIAIILSCAFVTVQVRHAMPHPAGPTLMLADEHGHGSGVYMGDGLVLTVAHVVADQKTIKVISDRGVTFIGEVLWESDKYDVALVRISKDARITPAALACRHPVTGERIESVGNPLGLQFAHSWGRVSTGLIHYGDETELFAADVAIAPGSSGGPVFDGRGYILGLNDAVPMSNVGAAPYALIVPSLTVCGLLGR